MCLYVYIKKQLKFAARTVSVLICSTCGICICREMIVPSRFYVRKILKLVSKYLFIDVDFIRLPFGSVGVALRSLQLQIIRYILQNFEILIQYNHVYSAIAYTTIVVIKDQVLKFKDFNAVEWAL